jgi:lysophospholipase L1-like esterase
MSFVNDTFTDTAGTLLPAHTGETGATWTQHANWTGVASISSANRLYYSSAGNTVAVYYASGTPASADYDVQATIRRLSSVSQEIGVMGRAATAANDWYWARYSHANGRWELWVGLSMAGTYTQALSDDTDYVLKLEMRGTAIKVYVDGVERISITDSTYTSAGRAAVFFGATSSGDTTGYHLDSFSATDATASFAAGTASVTSYGLTTATVTASPHTGGTGTVTRQWERSTSSGSGYSNVSGATSLTLNDTGLTRGTTYYYRLKWTDSSGSPVTVTSNEISLTTRTSQIVCDGDSITAGDGLSAGNKYPEQLQAILGNAWQVDNVGVSGQTLDNMQTTRTDVDSLYSGSNAYNVNVCFGGTNDIYFNASAATTETRVQAYCAASRSTGFKVVVCTLLPRGDFPGTSTLPADAETNHETRRLAFNTWLRANWSTFADALCDLAADARLGDDGDEDDTTYYQGDKVHPNSVGAAKIAERVAAAVAMALNPAAATGGTGGVRLINFNGGY